MGQLVPVIVARNGISLTKAGDHSEQLKKQLEKMADVKSKSACRLIMVPNSAIVAVLKKTDITEVRKQQILSRPSVVWALDDVDALK